LLITAVSNGAWARVPNQIGYQGRLSRIDGSPVAGIVAMTFSIYDSGVSGALLGCDAANVALTDGFYALFLGGAGGCAGGKPAIDMSAFSGKDLWLEVAVEDVPLAPRQRFASVPYSQLSGNAVNVKGGGVVEAATLMVEHASVTGSLSVSGSTDLIPPGTILAYAGKAAPPGWFLCDGSAVSRTKYAALFAAVEITYGGGDGITTFNLPDARGRVILGAGDGSGLTSRSVGQRLGEEAHALTVAEMPAHSHSGQTGGVNIHATSDPRAMDYGPNGSDRGFNFSSYSLSGGNFFNEHQHPVTTVAVGGSGAHNTIPPSLVLNWIIKY
jgi:microcystin-dependent protein